MTILKASPLPLAGHLNQIWMAGPFEVSTWYAPAPLRAERKGDELRVGAPFKLDLAGPAWLVLVGRKPDGTWTLLAVAKANDQPPVAAAVPVEGPVLATIVEDEPAPEPEPEPEPAPEPEPDKPPLDPANIDCLILWRDGVPGVPAIPKSYVVLVAPDLMDALLGVVREKLIETIGAQIVRDHLDSLKGGGL
jgi:hypothetical protein